MHAFRGMSLRGAAVVGHEVQAIEAEEPDALSMRVVVDGHRGAEPAIGFGHARVLAVPVQRAGAVIAEVADVAVESGVQLAVRGHRQLLHAAQRVRMVEHAPARAIEQQHAADVDRRDPSVAELDQRLVDVAAVELLGVVDLDQRLAAFAGGQRPGQRERNQQAQRLESRRHGQTPRNVRQS